MQVTTANAAPPPSATCMIAPDLLFLGSWVGDSLLIHAAPEDQVGSNAMMHEM